MCQKLVIAHVIRSYLINMRKNWLSSLREQLIAPFLWHPTFYGNSSSWSAVVELRLHNSRLRGARYQNPKESGATGEKEER